MKKSVHQFVSSFSPRDAVGNIVLSIRDILREAGYYSNIYAETIHPEMKNEAICHTKYSKENSNDILIYHHSFASYLIDYLLPLQQRIVLIYHNITPSHFFKGVDENIVAGSEHGRKQLTLLKEKVNVALCFSKYSEEELKQKGFSNTVVIPAIINLEKHDYKKNISLINKFQFSTNIISVGRIAPHKKIEDILKVFAYYSQCINEKSNLFIIGKYDKSDPYYQWLQDVINTLNLKNINFLDDVPDEDLMSYYELADISIILSEHEGFCIPLVESMTKKVPILAYGAGAIPETLGDAGILLQEKNYEEIAEMIHLIVNDQKIREKIVTAQNKRLQSLDSNDISSEFLNQIKNVEKIPTVS